MRSASRGFMGHWSGDCLVARESWGMTDRAASRSHLHAVLPAAFSILHLCGMPYLQPFQADSCNDSLISQVI